MDFPWLKPSNFWRISQDVPFPFQNPPENLGNLGENLGDFLKINLSDVCCLHMVSDFMMIFMDIKLRRTRMVLSETKDFIPFELGQIPEIPRWTDNPQRLLNCDNPQTNHQPSFIQYLVGGLNPSEKYESQWEGWHPIYYGYIYISKSWSAIST